MADKKTKRTSSSSEESGNEGSKRQKLEDDESANNLSIILGASGQIGSVIVNDLFVKGQPVRGIIHSDKIKFEKGISTQFADFFDLQSTIQALKGGKTVFIITPENPKSLDIFKDISIILNNIKIAVKEAGIKKVVGLSCVGADIESGTGNILMQRMLEHTFDDVDVQKVFIRPTYFYSNWLFYMDVINNSGVLPSFIPKNLKVNMLSPIDLAHFCAEQILSSSDLSERIVYELFGPEKYSPDDICSTFEKVLNKKISVQCVEKQNWKKTFMENGFTENAAQNMADMTNALVENFEGPKGEKKIEIKLPMTFEAFLRIKTKTE